MLRTELISTIRDVHAGKRRIQPEIAADIAGHVASDNLTTREVEVLRKIAQGSSNKVVAADLGISEDTVKDHMKNILSAGCHRPHPRRPHRHETRLSGRLTVPRKAQRTRLTARPSRAGSL